MHLHDLLDTLFTRLVWTSAQAMLLIGLVTLVVRLFPRLPAALRCTLWWLIGAQLLIGLCWPAPVALHLLPASPHAARIATPAITGPRHIAATGTTNPQRAEAERGHVAQTGLAPAPASGRRMPSLPSMLIALWFAGVLLHATLAIRHWRRSQQVVRDSSPLHDPRLDALCRQQAKRLGLRHAPELRSSHAIESPQITGLRRTVIMLPAGDALNANEAAMALAHELAHLRRGDLWLGWVPALAQRLFFFHPLASRAMREYALCREAACDALVLEQTGIDAGDYGHLLLRLGVASPLRPGLAGASPSFRNLKRRLTMLQQHDATTNRAALWAPVLLIALAGVVPWRVTARPATNAQPSTPTHVSARTSPQGESLATAEARSAGAASATPEAHATRTGRHIHIDTDTRDHARDGFALIDGDSMIVQGATADLDHARRLRGSDKAVLWVRHGDKAWVIHDKATLKAAHDAYAPVIALSREQGKLAGKQGELAGKQAGLAGEQAAAASRQASLAGHQAALAARQAAMIARETARRSSEQAELQARRAALDAERSSLQNEMQARTADAGIPAAERAKAKAELARRLNELAARRQALDTRTQARDKDAQEEHAAAMQFERAELQRERARMQKQEAQSHTRIAARQHALAEQQKAIGAQQRTLSERQKAATAEAQERMQKLLDRAIAKGTAQPVQVD